MKVVVFQNSANIISSTAIDSQRSLKTKLFKSCLRHLTCFSRRFTSLCALSVSSFGETEYRPTRYQGLINRFYKSFPLCISLILDLGTGKMEFEKIKQRTQCTLFKQYLSRVLPFGISTPNCISYSVYRSLRLTIIPTAYCDSKFAADTQVKTSQAAVTSHVHVPVSPVKDAEVNAVIQNETGMDRVRMMYFRDPVTKGISPDLESVAAKTVQAALTGAIASFLFKKEIGPTEVVPGINQLQQYSRKAQYDVQRRILDRMLLNRMNMMFKWGLIAGLFVGSFFLTAQTVATYRNKSSPFEYAAGGVVTGSLFRIHIGPKAIITGGALVGTGGLLVGVLLYGLKYATDTTQDKLHFDHIKGLIESKSIPRPVLKETESDIPIM